MNYEKIQEEIIKDVFKVISPFKHKKPSYRVCTEDTILDGIRYTAVIGEYTAYLIPPDRFFIDSAKLPPTMVFCGDAGKIFKAKNERDYETAELTNAMEKLKDKNIIVRKLKSESATVWFNESFLKFFDSPGFMVQKPTSAIFVYENGSIAGLILPIRRAEEDR